MTRSAQCCTITSPPSAILASTLLVLEYDSEVMDSIAFCKNFFLERSGLDKLEFIALCIIHSFPPSAALLNAQYFSFQNDITVSEGLDNSLTPPEPMTKKGGNEDTEEGDNTDYHPEMLLTDSVNEEVTESYEKAIDITADVVTREALRRAQILDSDLNVAKEELLRQHAEEIDKLENKYCLQIANLKDDLWVDFRAQQAELLESFEVVKEKLLQELRELKNVLKETESKLHDTEMKLKENMELNGRLEEKWTKKLENERFQLQKKIVELENEIQQKEANETSLREVSQLSCKAF